MTIRRYIPAKLSGLVDLIWEQRSNTPTQWRILPSGKVELIFQLGTVAQMRSARIISKQDHPLNLRCFLSGLHTGPIALSFDTFHNFGIQMKPFAVRALFGIPSCEIRDYYIAGETVMKALAEVEDLLGSAGSFAERAAFVERWLLARVNEMAGLHQAIALHRAIDKITTLRLAGENRSIERYLGYSRTHTFRLFNDWFGLPARAYQRLMQFVKTIQLLHQPEERLLEIGLVTGYYDQAHFIHAFKTFAGMTPKEYRQHKTHLPGQLPY